MLIERYEPEDVFARVPVGGRFLLPTRGDYLRRRGTENPTNPHEYGTETCRDTT